MQSDCPQVVDLMGRRARARAQVLNYSRSLAGLALVFFVQLFQVSILLGQDAPQASRLDLQQAVKIALEKNPQRKAAIADTRAAAADVKQAKSFLYPHVLFSETATAGDDPVYVFGSRLRQERFAQPDFALNVLNTPLPIGNFASRFGGTWNLFDSLASWHAVDRAQDAKDAAEHGLERADQEIVFRVVGAYYSVLLADKQLVVAQKAVEAAQAILDRGQNRVESGVAVESDSLSARVRLAARKQELIRAKNDAAMARAEWTTAMGLSSRGDYDPADELVDKTLPVRPLEELEKQAIERRPDLKEIRSEEAAQQKGVSIAKASFGPRVNAFADWEADNPSLFGGGGGNNWVAGVEVQIDLFQGGAKRAELSRARAQLDKISAAKESAADDARLEIRKAYYDVDASRQQLEVARAAIAESQESLRINQDRYDAGLLAVADLLAAEDAARRTQAEYWETLCHYYMGYAALELASGTLNPQSPVVLP